MTDHTGQALKAMRTYRGSHQMMAAPARAHDAGSDAGLDVALTELRSPCA